MSTGTQLHHPQDPTGDSLFALGNTDNNDASYAQDPLWNFGAGTGAAPAPVPALTDTLYLTEPGTTSPISVSDINQGQLGDCFLLSSLGEEVLFHPSAITGMIHNAGNGTETVTLYTDKSGRVPSLSSTSFKATAITVNNTFSPESVNNGATQDVVGNLKEIWPQVVEKAVATLDGGYNAIANGGYPVLAMEELTGEAASWMSASSLTLATLQKFVSADDLITMDTGSKDLSYGLVGGHCYMFDKIIGSGSSASVQLLNPWGFDEPSAIPLSGLARSGLVQVDVGHVG